MGHCRTYVENCEYYEAFCNLEPAHKIRICEILQIFTLYCQTKSLVRASISELFVIAKQSISER